MDVLVAPWAHPARLWKAWCYVASGLVTGIVCFVVVVVLLALAFGLMPVFLLGLPVLWVFFGVVRALSALERSRARALLGRQITEALPPLTKPTKLGRLGERLRSGRRWQQVAYHLLSLVTTTVGYAVVTAAWSGAAAMVSLPWWLGALPDDTAHLWFFDLHDGWGPVGAAAVGAAGLAVVAPWVTTGVARGQGAMAAALLGRSREGELAEQVQQLEESRVAAVDSAETERRRIERDLHDGAQQRLVALAASLGAAKEKLDADPDAGRAMVEDAHREAKEALKELRDLVRGIHPVILEDRGLDAALSAVVARCPVPVELDVRLSRRPPAAVESAAYFVVSEALTNVARHSRATKAQVGITRAGDRLVLEVHDDGVGGADASRGTGLQGLRDRVTGMGGSMHVLSPPGGPTTLSVELPCGS